MKLNPINVMRMPYLDSGSFIDRFLTDFSDQNIDATFDPIYKDLHQAIVDQSPKFKLAIMQVRANAESVELIALDIHRDRKITTLRRAHSVFQYTDDAAEKTAYGVVKTVIDTYKGIETVNYEAETLAIDNLIAELRNAQYLPSVQKLGLEVHINNLELSNNNFKMKFNSRSTDTISTEVFDAKKLRKEILQSYRELAEYVVVLAKRKPNEVTYKKILDVLNNGRSYFATLLAKRAATNGGDDEAASA
jgi:hypothetical protein